MSMRIATWGVVLAGAATYGCGKKGDSGPAGPSPNSTPASVSISQGDKQSGLTGLALTNSLQVLVKNQSGNPMAGVAVTWAITAGGGTVSASGATSTGGLATTTWTLGSASGENTLEARVGSLSPARFSATAVSVQTAIAIEVRLAGGGPTEIVLINPDGTGFVNLTNHAADDGEPNWSPDRSRIAFKSNRPSGTPGEHDVYVMNNDGTGVTRLTSAAGPDVEADWSPDGTKIAFRTRRDGNDEIYVMNADGSNLVRLTNNADSDKNPDWSADGTRILFATTRYGNREIAVMNADGTGVVRLTTDGADDDEPVWSPDGTKIAFATDRFALGTVYEVVLMNADGTGVTRLAAHAGNQNDYGPSWSPDGAKIAYTCWRLRGTEVFSEVCSMNADGTGEVRLTNPAILWASWAAWRH